VVEEGLRWWWWGFCIQVNRGQETRRLETVGKEGALRETLTLLTHNFDGRLNLGNYISIKEIVNRCPDQWNLICCNGLM
jgi:hypothetical protein